MELAGIYNELGLREAHAGLAASYLEKAVENWDRVMKLPGTFTSTHRELEVLSEYTQHRIHELITTSCCVMISRRLSAATTSTGMIKSPLLRPRASSDSCSTYIFSTS